MLKKKTTTKPRTFKAKLFSFEYLLHDIVKWLGWWQVALWYRVKVKYDGPEAKRKIKGKAIILSNHVGLSDPFVLQCAILYRRFHFVVMKEIMTNKFIEWMYRRVFLSFPIDRDNPSHSTIRFLGDYVRGGHLLAVFPEGHIKKDDVIDSFKGGVALIAYLSDAPIIPVYHQRRKSIWRMTKVVIGKPFYIKDLVGPILNLEKIKEAMKKLHEYELYLQELC
ncbi:MAG TPA: 1-acyl-sn-glycerol-3-phosphate acyltransferase [Erysipelotrichaceae bacterium]|nr:1-acyl-sn-glycerol-3-phosphate acyltransferase [Erysipelotrichaceae bacterium]